MSEKNDDYVSGPARRYIPWWKRSYLINRDLQFRFARSALIVGLTSAVVSAGLILWSFWAFNIWQGQRLPTGILVVIGGAMLLNMLGIFTITIIATHKIVGPMFNLIRQFSRLTRGQFNLVVRFRTDDEMQYVGRKFNEMAMHLHERNEYIFKQVTGIAEAITTGDINLAKSFVQDLQEMHKRENSEESHGA